MRCQTQWRISALGQVTGFYYDSVLAIAKLYEYDDLKSVIEDLQIMEIKAIEISNNLSNNSELSKPLCYKDLKALNSLYLMTNPHKNLLIVNLNLHT